MPGAGLLQTNILVYFINDYPGATKTTTIHSRNIEDERMLKSDWPRVT